MSVCGSTWITDWIHPLFKMGRPGYRVAKRMLDIAGASVLLILISPLMIGIWIYVNFHLPGDAIFRHTRIKRNRRTGKDRRNRSAANSAGRYCRRQEEEDRRKLDHFGEPFTLFKFTTMYPDARDRFPDFFAFDYTEDEIKEIDIKPKNDPRVPPWARWLRQSSLDELPNLFNVLRNDISLVGPRPDLPEFVKYYTEQQRRIKLSVMPGVTGYAQIRGRGNLSLQETLSNDIEYVRDASFSLDLKILFLTFIILLKGRSGGAF